MYLSWIAIGVLVLEVFWAGRLWQRTVTPAQTDGQLAGTIPTLRELLRVVAGWEEEHQDSLEEMSEDLGGAPEEHDGDDDASPHALPLPPAVRSVLQTLPGHVAAFLGSEVWHLPLSEVPAHVKAFQEGRDSGANWHATPDEAGGEAPRAADSESPMRPVVRRLQRARDVLRRLEGREAPPPSEPLDAGLNDPVHEVPLGILALALIAANATSALQQLREELQDRLRRAEEQLQREQPELLEG